MSGKSKSPNAYIATHRFAVTFFKNIYASASSRTEEAVTLLELRDLILRTKRRTKSGLPWLKLARFGDEPNVDENGEGKCLRWDGNVISFSGIELDYDKGKISLDTALKTLKKMKVRALLYSTPSHTAMASRWRLLMPVSRKLPLSMRAKLCARVNGYFGGIFARESFTLSQSYYFGLSKDNPKPDHRAEVVDGRFIDLCIDDLYRFEKIGWPSSITPKELKAKKIKRADVIIRNSDDDGGNRNEFHRHFTDVLVGNVSDALDSMDYREKHGGIGVHHSQRDISYQLIANGMRDKEVIELLMTATFALPEAIKWNRKEELRRITKLCRGAHARLAREESEAIEMPSPDGRPMLSIEEFRARQRKGLANIFWRKQS